MEEWKTYKETYNTRWGKIVYEVSNLGRVKKNGVLFECIKNNGYLGFGKFYVHRAVAELFIPNPENKPCIDHINTVKTDNRADNLRWVTYKENSNNPLTKIYMSNTLKGRILSEETKQKMSDSHKGSTLSEETKQKISKSLKCKTHIEDIK